MVQIKLLSWPLTTKVVLFPARPENEMLYVYVGVGTDVDYEEPALMMETLMPKYEYWCRSSASVVRRMIVRRVRTPRIHCERGQGASTVDQFIVQRTCAWFFLLVNRTIDISISISCFLFLFIMGSSTFFRQVAARRLIKNI